MTDEAKREATAAFANRPDVLRTCLADNDLDTPMRWAFQHGFDAGAADAKSALLRLANAADNIGMAYFDTDTEPPVVMELREATAAAREILK